MKINNDRPYTAVKNDISSKSSKNEVDLFKSLKDKSAIREQDTRQVSLNPFFSTTRINSYTIPHDTTALNTSQSEEPAAKWKLDHEEDISIYFEKLDIESDSRIADMNDYVFNKFGVKGQVLKSCSQYYPNEYHVFYYESDDINKSSMLIVQLGNGEKMVVDVPEDFQYSDFKYFIMPELTKFCELYDISNADVKYESYKMKIFFEEFLENLFSEK